MSRPAINMIDVAKAAGVSVGTVSRALSGNKGVSEQTRRRIRKIADELGYVVSPEASNLAVGRTGRVGLVTPVINAWFYSSMIAAIADELHHADIDIALYPLSTEREQVRFFDELPARRKVDAVIVIAYPINDAEWQRIDSMGVHVVVAGYVVPGRPSVGIDDEQAARQAVNHLLALGHRRIAMISSEDREGLHYAPDLGRQRGYRTALQSAGIDTEPVVVSTPWGIDGGRRGMDLLLARPELPTAVFAFSDELAVGAIQSIRSAGLQTPQDISVVSIDDHPMAALMELTTVRQDVHRQGSEAGRMCLDLINEKPVEEQVTCPTHLIVRRTTSPPPLTRIDGNSNPLTESAGHGR